MPTRHQSTIHLEHVLLALLDTRSMHGYELYQVLCRTQGISRVWNIKQALLYALLDKLETQGLIRSQPVQVEDYPTRHSFSLTESGKAALATWLRTPVRKDREMRQEFLAKLIIARRYGKTAALDLIRAQEKECQAWLDELETDQASAQPDEIDEWLVHSFRLDRVKGVLAWLQQCATVVEDRDGSGMDRAAE